MDVAKELIQAIGADPMIVAGFLAFVVLICQMIGKSIPDTATGPLGVIRKIAKVLGLYVANKVKPDKKY